MKRKTNKILIYSVVIVVFVALILFFFLSSGGNISSGVGTTGTASDGIAWMNVELTDVNSGDIFKVSEFRGKPVLLETFAVWCPTCTKQQRNLRKLHDTVGEDVISISLDVDPNEDEERVKEHTQNNGFNWRYSVAPIEMTKSLIDDFGASIVSAPSSPMILICEDGSFRKLGGFGARSADKLQEEIARGCGG